MSAVAWSIKKKRSSCHRTRTTTRWRTTSGSTPSPAACIFFFKQKTAYEMSVSDWSQTCALPISEQLDVTIRPGGPDIVPEQVVAGGGAQFGIDWLPSLLSARDQGAPLVNIGQVFAYSGMREIAFKSSGIKGAGDLKGRRVAVWFGGNEFELLATLEKYKIDRNKDVTLVPQPFDMNLLLQKKVDAAAAMTYNEYKQVLDAGVKPDDLVVIDFNKEGTAMLEDGIFAKADWISDAKNRDVAARFVRASLKGWEFCRDKPAECVD